MLIKTYLNTKVKEISIYSDTMMCQGERKYYYANISLK